MFSPSLDQAACDKLKSLLLLELREWNVAIQLTLSHDYFI